MQKYTETEKAESFFLWQEYIDPQATMTESEFDDMTVNERIALIHDCFGCDGTCDD